MPNPGQSWVHRIMGLMRRLMPSDPSGENTRAVHMFGQILKLRDLLSGRFFRKWPVTAGNYIVSDPNASVAVCTLTSKSLMKSISEVEGVAICGSLVTANLGIEKIILNTLSNPAIRFLLLCGEESPVFHPAQTIRSLFNHGVDANSRIIEAEGHYPVLSNLDTNQIDMFREQVELVDCRDETKVEVLRNRVAKLASQKRQPFEHGQDIGGGKIGQSPKRLFKKIRPGGKRGTTEYDPAGFFVITLDREAGYIVLRHYQTDNTPGHEMKGRRADAMMRALIREGLISQLSHAAYLGEELAKAETALRLNLSYEQDQPLKKS